MRDTKSKAEQQFYEALRSLRDEAGKALGRPLNGLRRSMEFREGADAAREVLRPGKQLDTFADLLMAGHQDLTVEHLVLKEQWRCLFEAHELQEAEHRLRNK